MNIVSPLEPHPQSAKLMQPRERALHHPAVDSEAAPVRGASLREHGFDAARPERPLVGGRVVRPVSVELLGPPPRTSALPADGRDGIDEFHELGDVVGVRGGELRGERYAAGVGDEVVLAAGFGAVRGIRAGFFPRRRPHAPKPNRPLRATSLSHRPPGACPGERGGPSPTPRLLPLAQAPPAGHARAAPHLLREHFPRDAALQDEEVPVKTFLSSMRFLPG